MTATLKNSRPSLRTLTATVGVDQDTAHGSVMPPLYLSSNYSFDGFGGKRAYDYTRSGNPTRDVLADLLAQLEGGAGAIVVATGMAAVDLILQPLPPGALVVAPHDCYGGTWRLLLARERQGRIRVQLVDQNDPLALDAVLAQGPALVMIESPSNPLMRLVDIEAVAKKAKAVGAKVSADNTFLSPVLQQPLALGADFVIHSTTKYINGHSDVVGGAVVTRTLEDHQELKWWANCTGVTGSPFDSYQTLRGARTLYVRMKAQEASATAIAQFLSQHPAVQAVHYPGLEDHTSHDLAKRQQKGFGAMLSFELKGGEAKVRELLQDLPLFTLAESLGGIESLVAHPATMTHAAMAPEAQLKAGIVPGLLRLSIGLEAPDDLVDALRLGLDRLI